MILKFYLGSPSQTLSEQIHYFLCLGAVIVLSFQGQQVGVFLAKPIKYL